MDGYAPKLRTHGNKPIKITKGVKSLLYDNTRGVFAICPRHERSN